MAATTHPYVGRSIPRVEDLRLLTGGGRYGADFDIPGQLHARIVRSQVAHGRIRAIDTAAAADRSGVLAVLTAEDVPEVRIPIRLFATDNANRVLQPPLARGTVRYVGDPIALVLASDPYVAEDAAEDVLVEIEPLEVVLDPFEAASGNGVMLHPTINGNVIDRVAISHGEVSAAVRPWWPARPVSALIETSAAPYRMPPAAASICVRRCLSRSRHAPAQTEPLR